jgi:predicted metal-dependent peptidase
MYDPCETEFNLDRHLISFLQDNPFFAELSRHIHKTPTKSLPTAAVAYNEKTDELTLLWNPDFFAKLSQWEVRGVLTHEYYHLVFGHLYGRRRTPPQLWNIGTDLAINSIIMDSSKNGAGNRLQGERPLPEFALVPGRRPKHPDGREYTKDEEQAQKLAAVIEKLPTMKASEWYFEKIKEESDKDKAAGGSGFDGEGEGTEYVIGSMDEHGTWQEIPEEQREYVEGRVKAVIEKATKHADSQANGWGNIPIDLADQIRKSVSSIINWRNVLRQFVGSITRGGRSTSIKRINSRYPYIHPGVKRGYTAKLLIAIDQSGSVSNEMLADFFGELGSLTKKVSIDILPFDTEAYEKDLYEWRRGTNHPAKRVRGGGTDFNAPTRFANDPRNRGRWDGMLIMTDGECSAPSPSRIKRGYVIGKGHKLYFDTNEIVIKMDDVNKTEGAWR